MKRSISTNKNLKHSFFAVLLVFLLFFPGKNIYVHIIGLFAISMIPWLTGLKLFPSPIPYIFLILVYISTVIGIFIFETNAIRNATELLRVFLFLTTLIFFYNLEPQRAFETFKKVAFYFIILNFSLMLSQFLQVGMTDSLTNIYGSENHIELSLGISNRALGLSSGPGQAGAISVVFFTIFYAIWLLGDKSWHTILIIVLAFASVLLSQSQTSFIIMVGIIAYGILYSAIKLKNIKPLIIAYILLSIGFSFFWDFISTDLQYLFSLFDQGLERNSYKAREIKTAHLFSLTMENPLGIIFGYGKDYFGHLAGAMDNEYMFLYGVYGLIFLLIIVFCYLTIIAKSWLVKKSFYSENPYLLPLSFLIVIGIIMSWPASFILDIRIMLILTFFIAIYFKKKNKQSKQKKHQF